MRKELTTMKTSLTAHDIVVRGREIYEKSIKPDVERAENIGKFVTIDIDSGDYVLDVDRTKARNDLVSRKPDAVIYLVKVGYSATAVIGGRLLPNPEWRSN
jgi:hypothetical protein